MLDDLEITKLDFSIIYGCFYNEIISILHTTKKMTLRIMCLGDFYFPFLIHTTWIMAPTYHVS